jgi:hypothetical protein
MLALQLKMREQCSSQQRESAGQEMKAYSRHVLVSAYYSNACQHVNVLLILCAGSGYLLTSHLHPLRSFEYI